jgi:flagellar M-ring protein FliF
MQPINELRDKAMARWAAAGARERALFLAAIAAVAALGILGYAQTSRTTMAVLFSGLSEQDAAGIVGRLRESHVQYELAENGTTILVPEHDVHETRLSLAAEGLPAGGGIGFEIFDTQRFGESEFVEQVQYLRALEGELGRTIGALAGVDQARVHLVLPQRTLISGSSEHARASIAVRMQPGHTLHEDQVRGIVHLVASSVRDLSPENVTVVDGNGRRLDGADDTNGPATADDAEGVRERIERGRERHVQDLLDSTLGPGVAVVRLTADVSFSQQESLEEAYDPDRTATRSFEITDEGAAQGSGTSAGVAGAVSALPGGPSAEQTSATGEGTRHSEVRNFEITKRVVTTREPLGRLVRLSAAVVVDGRYEGEGDDRHFVPRTDEELARIRAVVMDAAGMSQDRGDTLTVECVPFSVPAQAEGALATGDAALARPAWQYAALGAGAVALLGVLAGLVVARRRRRQGAEEGKTLAISAEPALPGALATDTAAAGTGTALEKTEDPELLDPEAIRVRVIDFARREPEVAARIVKAWLQSDVSADAPKVEEPAEAAAAH